MNAPGVEPFNLADTVTGAMSVHANIAQDVIFTTEDKLRLVLADYRDAENQRAYFVAPLGIFITIALTLVTTDFKNAVLPKETWFAIFLLSALICFVFAVRAILERKPMRSIDAVIDRIKLKR